MVKRRRWSGEICRCVFGFRRSPMFGNHRPANDGEHRVAAPRLLFSTFGDHLLMHARGSGSAIASPLRQLSFKSSAMCAPQALLSSFHALILSISFDATVFSLVKTGVKRPTGALRGSQKFVAASSMPPEQTSLPKCLLGVSNH